MANDSTSGKKKFFEKIKEERRTPIDAKKKEEMLAVLIRNQEAFETVQELFKINDCKHGVSEPLSLVWKLVRKFYKDYSELPGKVQLESEIHDALSGNPSLVTEEEAAELDEFLTFAWDDKEHGKNIAKSKVHMRAAVDTCKGVLEELVAADIQEKMLKEGTLPADITALLQASQTRLDMVQSITEIDLAVPFPEGWDKRAETSLMTTGSPVLDVFMGGGWRAKECLLFMAPYGSCKTTLACDATAGLILHASELALSGKARKDKHGNPMTPVVVLIFTESDKDEYRNRLMANMAKVPWKRLMDMAGIDDLDKGKKPGAKEITKYELKEFKDKLKKDKDKDSWANEQMRVRNAMKAANKHLMLVDCTDDDENPHKIGSGGMQEVANVMKGVFRKKKDCYPIAFWLDHVSGLIDRMGDAIKDEAELRRVLTNMPRLAIEKIGKPFNCPVGLMHQFSGASQNRGVVAKLHHSDGEGSKSVGKYANFCVVCGKVDENLMCMWECTKHRREPPSSTRIVKVEGDFSRLLDCTHTHGVEPGRNIIISKDDMQSVNAFKKSKSAGYGEIVDASQNNV